MVGGDAEGERATDLAAGEIAVLELPNARADTEERGRPSIVVTGPARVVMIAADGDVVAEVDSVDRSEVSVPVGVSVGVEALKHAHGRYSTCIM